MNSETLLLIILAGITAILLAGFQYFRKSKSMSKQNMLFMFLRFISFFSIGLLLINPKFEQISKSIEKPNLIVAVDNSNSVNYLDQEENVENLVQLIANNKVLADKFNIDFYAFGNELKNLDSLAFLDKQTNIDKVFNQLNQVYKNSSSPTLIITDGNQTYGNDYEFSFSKYKQPIYPVILGDTITYTDLKIQQLNVNKYAFLKNQFPVEAILMYNGNENIDSRFVVYRGNNVLYSQNLSFTKSDNSRVINFTLPASNVGVTSYRASLIPLEIEKNKLNNTREFAVDIIDQKTKIAIVSSFLHPDLGVFKKTIERNEQRSVSFLEPQQLIDEIDDFQLVILYQPNYEFKALMEELNTSNKNKWIVVGTKTDLEFLNSVTTYFQHEITGQLEEYQAELNMNYTPFMVDDINFESLPPLRSSYGTLNFNIPFETILTKTINGINTFEPLLATFDTNSRREAILLGENLWQWRAQSFVMSKSFNPFDDFISKIIQYLSTNTQRTRLNLDYETFYNGSTSVIVKAQYFDKNYQFDPRESLTITIKDEVSEDMQTIPLVLKKNSYEVDLSNLPPSKYAFSVSAAGDNISKSGTFQILEYNVEQQFLNANVMKLQRLAAESSGKSYFIEDAADVIQDLIVDNRYLPIQKRHKNSLPLIDWKYLLLIIVLSLSIEWFIRKYNGLI
ncbi:VWA domain-containing protein [Aestuariivivens sediminicola]|uniref:VWA domain-containing protein n=1 Tax=Aestuariivivens sediminicola TaxID=2913560 RepID=UPI001F5710CA|nr:VWA domain-containing protein [Aestuariivivens sediminicola]